MELYSESLDVLKAHFAGLGISTDSPGFYDHPAFAAQERVNQHFLSAYARYVQLQPYSREYLVQAEWTVRRATELLHNELARDGRLGACIDASMALSRMLEREGIWNICIQGAITMTFGSGKRAQRLYCQPVDDSEAIAAHVWVYAPPFQVVDVTISRQRIEEKLRRQLPGFVLAKHPPEAVVVASDICSAPYRQNAARQGITGRDTIYAYRPGLREFFQIFPACEVATKQVSIKFVPCATGASDAPLENITALTLSGRGAHQIYEEIIKPGLRRSA